ncbi:hypothetical protein [Geodermatophilus sp. FMUSA9-8]|uniref:hypothetical protein n=1 Tax=Geodermatophilus sp. FMUSA9-8 TaxID=3120155 RepID=UPI0030093DAD
MIESSVVVHQQAVAASAPPLRWEAEGATGDQVQRCTEVGDAVGSAGEAADAQAAEKFGVDEDAVDPVPHGRGGDEPRGQVLGAGCRIGAEPGSHHGDGLANLGLADDVGLVGPDGGRVPLADYAAPPGRQ